MQPCDKAKNRHVMLLLSQLQLGLVAENSS